MCKLLIMLRCNIGFVPVRGGSQPTLVLAAHHRSNDTDSRLLRMANDDEH